MSIVTATNLACRLLALFFLVESASSFAHEFLFELLIPSNPLKDLTTGLRGQSGVKSSTIFGLFLLIIPSFLSRIVPSIENAPLVFNEISLFSIFLRCYSVVLFCGGCTDILVGAIETTFLNPNVTSHIIEISVTLLIASTLFCLTPKICLSLSVSRPT